MAYEIDLKTFTDKRGNLTVIEKTIPFQIKRIFYIYGVDDSVRGGHRHHKTVQAAICLQGTCHNHQNFHFVCPCKLPRVIVHNLQRPVTGILKRLT